MVFLLLLLWFNVIEMRSRMKILKLVPVIVALAFSTIAADGQGYEDANLEKDVERIRDLFENDMYVSVRNEVAVILEKGYNGLSDILLSELESYSVISGIKLKQVSLDGQVSDFERKYPFSARLSLVKFYQSAYYFNEGDYARCLAIFKGVENKYLGESERYEYMFMKAYCNMRVGNNDEAKVAFRQIISLGNGSYYASSVYYLGYLSYLSTDFREAIKLFGKLHNHNEYGLLSMYYTSESYFMMKDYQKAIEFGEKVYDKLSGDFRIKSVRILSQSYYELDNSREAKRYLEMYSEQSGHLSRKDNYYSGVVSYSLQSYYAAVEAFKKVVNLRDSLAQNGYLYLGNSYLKIKNKLNAMGAFKEASSMEFDPVIQEEAHFLYAKLAFDLNSDIAPFNEYIQKYPSSSKSDEIYNYIATSYLGKKDFKEAIVALENIRKLTPEMVLNLQKAAFFRAMQLLDMNSYRSAIDYFNISVENGAYNPRLVSLAKFWMGEAYYRVNEYKKCIDLTAPLVESAAFAQSGEYPMALLNLGYSYFNQGNYSASRGWFERYMALPASRRGAFLEAKTRMADCHYMEKNYEKASSLYEDVAARTFDKDDIYATYMGALSYGLISQPQKKISMLNSIIDNKPNSGYYHKALYELGRTYVQEEENNEAVECFNILLQDGRDNAYYTKSLLELGMIHSNMSKYDSALSYFKKIVEGYPMSEDVMSALAGIESVYQLLNKPDEYLAYLDKVGMSSVKSADEKEQMLFNSAEKLYLSGKYQEALNSLNSFIAKYPDGIKTPQAYFYLAESYNKTGKPEFASDAYLKVMTTGEGAFVELATLYYAKTELGLEHFGKAADAFENLELIAQLDNNKLEAKIGKFRSFYGDKQYGKCIAEGTGILASAPKDEALVKEVEYKMAKSYMYMGDREAALPLFTKLATEYSTAEGAESAYILISNAYDQGDFDKVENMVYAFSDAGTSQMYWLAKSFIVLGDSFAEREEWEQAKATFESVKEGYTPQKEHDDVLEQVEMRLSKIKVNE